MVAYCNDCKRYVNQFCERCGGNVGISVCEWYGCGGRMLCPLCGGNNLSSKKEERFSLRFREDKVTPPYRKNRAPSEIESRFFRDRNVKQQKYVRSDSDPSERLCPMCGYHLQMDWKFCPECGISLL